MKSLFYLLTILFLSACGLNSNPSPLVFSDNSKKVIVDPIKVEDPAFANIQSKLFERSCNNCHNPKKPKRLDLTKKENLIKEYEDIMYRMTDTTGVDTMPPTDKGEAVPESVIEEYKAWKEAEDKK